MTETSDFAPTEIFNPAGDTTVPLRPNRMRIEFTGSSSEYFRIWIVNLLLTLVTLSLYLPFARARRMSYFQSNTLVDGDPLGFHGDPWRMFRGYLVVLVLGIAYSLVGNFYPALNWVALLVFALVWPALWRASLRFRLRNTSWRGVRFAFEGDVKSAYTALLPFFIPALVFLIALPQDPEMQVDRQEVMKGLGIVGLVVLSFLLVSPWLWARVKRYQQGGYSFAQERTELTATTGQFYALFGKALLLSMALSFIGAVVAGIVIAATAGVSVATGALQGNLEDGAAAVLIGVTVFAFGFLFYVVLPLLVGTYTTSRLQNLVWANTRSPRVSFDSELTFKHLLKITAVNWVLMVLTLGLYWPATRIRLAKAKLEAMSIEVEGNVDHWVARAGHDEGGAVGDAAGDFFDFDIGF